MLSILWPLLEICFCAEVFGGAGAFLLILAPLACGAAVIESAFNRKRILIPIICLVVSALLSARIFLNIYREWMAYGY
jgi:hypothetical protein